MFHGGNMRTHTHVHVEAPCVGVWEETLDMDLTYLHKA